MKFTTLFAASLIFTGCATRTITTEHHAAARAPLNANAVTVSSTAPTNAVLLATFHAADFDFKATTRDFRALAAELGANLLTTNSAPAQTVQLIQTDGIQHKEKDHWFYHLTPAYDSPKTNFQTSELTGQAYFVPAQ